MSEETEDALYNTAWDERTYPYMAAWIRGYQPGFDALAAISQQPECRFAIPQTLADTNAQMKRLNRMKGWARLLLWSANMDIAKGNPQAALEKQQAVLRMAQHLYQQQTLLDQSAAFDLELLAFRAQCLYVVEHCDSIETLDTLAQNFAQLDTGWAKSWATIVDRDKLVTKNIMGLLYETNDEGDTRIARSAMYALQEGLGYRPRKLFFRQHEMNRLAVIGLWLSLPTTPEGIGEMIDERFDYYSLQVQKGASLPSIPIQYFWRAGLNVESLIDWLAIERVRYFWALHGQNKRHWTIIDLMQLFSTLKKYHLQTDDWPENLQALVLNGMMQSVPIDTVYGKPIVYQKTADGFRLYSLGPNGVDDAGVNNPQENKDDIVFWPRLTGAEGFDEGLIAEITTQTP
jgi:hypothetical protein